MTTPYVPSNLQELLRGDKRGYELGVAYFLELQHTLMSHFPAVFRGTKRIVITLDLGLMKKVLETLPSRRFYISHTLFYANQELSIAFPILNRNDLEGSEPQQLLDEDEFNRLITQNPNPFEWAPGLLSLSVEPTTEEFAKMIEDATQ